MHLILTRMVFFFFNFLLGGSQEPKIFTCLSFIRESTCIALELELIAETFDNEPKAKGFYLFKHQMAHGPIKNTN